METGPIAQSSCQDRVGQMSRPALKGLHSTENIWKDAAKTSKGTVYPATTAMDSYSFIKASDLDKISLTWLLIYYLQQLDLSSLNT